MCGLSLACRSCGPPGTERCCVVMGLFKIPLEFCVAEGQSST
jgi:hypothetical protein